MAEPTSANESSPFVGAGVFWISSRPNDEAVFPYKDFVRWYEDVHIPDMIHADPDQPLPVARRYECAHPLSESAWDKRFLVVYKMPTLAFVASDAFRRIPLHHATLPEGGPIARFATFLGRFARHVDTWGRRGLEDEDSAGGLLLSEVIEPAQDAQDAVDAFHRWYREEYMRKEVMLLPGWRRSTRFEIVMENEIGGDAAPPPGPPPPRPTTATAKKLRWLTLHEFDVAKADYDIARPTTTSLLGTAEATRHMEAAAGYVEVVPFHLVRTYGDKAAAFASGE